MSETPSPSAAVAAGPTTPPTAARDDDDDNDAAPLEWSAFYDGDGPLYYYNSTTGESTWDAPARFHPPPPRDDQDETMGEADKEEEEAEMKDDKGEPSAEATAAIDQGEWVRYEDEHGREYFYNSASGERQWEAPDSFVDARDQVDSAVSPERAASPTMETEQKSEEQAKEETEEEPQEEVDPAVKRLEEAEKSLNQPDAVMEPDCLVNVGEVLAGHGGSVGAQKATQALIDSFQGETAVCGLLGLWLADLKSASSSSSEGVKKEDSFNSAADEVRDVVQGMINRTAKERFTKTGGDNILNLSKAEAAFLEEMIDSERWRKLLIDMSATHKDSALLMYCLQSISKRGHHREIAKRVNQSDHFAVYNAMLASEFAVVGKSASSSSCDLESSLGMKELVEDLRRTCTSTSYTYVYAIELLRDLLATAEKDQANGPQLEGATRKWRRLQEELEGAMVDSSSSSNSGSSTLFRKRQLDTALTVSELYQRQRRRQKPDSNVANGNDGLKNSMLETSLLDFIRKHSNRSGFDDSILDRLLPREGDDKNEIGQLLIFQPLVITSMLGLLFKPGSSRIASMVTRNKCARLIALAAMAATKSEDENGEEAAEITQMLLTASQLCELLENTVSFTVTSDVDLGGDDSSAGTKLCALSLKNAAIAQGVIMWATTVTQNPEFVTSASYPTLSPSILSLIRIISERHPFTRRAVIDIALVFLRHSNSEMAYQKMTELKEQCLRLLLLLLVQGEITAVLGNLTSRLKEQGYSEIDASLIRYFVGGLLDVLRPPYSLSFVRQLGGMLSTSRCKDALRSSYFGGDKKKQLQNLVNGLRESVTQSNGSSIGEDASLVSTLQSVYSVRALSTHH